MKTIADTLGVSRSNQVEKARQERQAPSSESPLPQGPCAKPDDLLLLPAIPAIVLARKAARGELQCTGATACSGLVTPDDYLEELEPYPVEMFSEPPTWIAGKGCYLSDGCEQAPEPVSSRY